MATANSVTFQTDKDSLFASTLEIIKSTGYIIAETDDAAKRLVYVAKNFKKWGLGGSEHHYEIIVTVSGSSERAMISVKVTETAHEKQNPYFKNDPDFESVLIRFLISELEKLYTFVPSERSVSAAPGTGPIQKGGCLVMLGFVGLLVASGVFGCYAFLVTLFP